MPADGTHGGIARLILEHRGALLGYIYSCVRNHHDAEEVLQDVCVVAIESADKLEDPSGFLPWAREIARRTVLSRFRSGARERSCDPELVERLAEASHRVDEAEPEATSKAALLACLDKLPRKLRKIVSMRYGPAVGSVAQAAESSGRTVQAVYAVLKRAKEALRVCVERRLARES